MLLDQRSQLVPHRLHLGRVLEGTYKFAEALRRVASPRRIEICPEVEDSAPTLAAAACLFKQPSTDFLGGTRQSRPGDLLPYIGCEIPPVWQWRRLRHVVKTRCQAY